MSRKTVCRENYVSDLTTVIYLVLALNVCQETGLPNHIIIVRPSPRLSTAQGYCILHVLGSNEVKKTVNPGEIVPDETMIGPDK